MNTPRLTLKLLNKLVALIDARDEVSVITGHAERIEKLFGKGAKNPKKITLVEAVTDMVEAYIIEDFDDGDADSVMELDYITALENILRATILEDRTECDAVLIGIMEDTFNWADYYSYSLLLAVYLEHFREHTLLMVRKVADDKGEK